MKSSTSKLSEKKIVKKLQSFTNTDISQRQEELRRIISVVKYDLKLERILKERAEAEEVDEIPDDIG